MTDVHDQDNEMTEVSEAQLQALDAEMPQLGALLRWSFDEALPKDAPGSDFCASLEDRLSKEMEQLDFVAEQQLLQHQFENILESRNGQWSAFAERVLDEARRQETQALGRPLEKQVYARMEDEIESTLDEMEARFEHQFMSQLVGRLAEPPRAGWQNLVNRFRQWMSPPPWAWGSIAVAMTALFVVFSASNPDKTQVLGPPASANGEVRVDAIQFEGTVTLSQSDEVTVIWLASASR